MKDKLAAANAKIEWLVAYVLAQPEIRETKVRSLQSAIRDGEYWISDGAVAKALLAEVNGSHEVIRVKS